MGVPDRILLKPDSLTDDEMIIMRQHPKYAYDMLSTIAYLSPALDIPYCHHERWDGKGYPRGLKARQIPLAARLFAVVDVWDALTSDRPYRPAWTRKEALEYIKELSGVQFEPAIVDKFVAMMKI
jgi:HD-GYP domain-containing protein (c-di-GMP phosphodiesterase class II)